MINHSLGVEAREVELKAGGVKLRARVGLPQAASGWVIFAHQGGASLHGSALAAVARQLNEAGLATLSMELLTPAESARRAPLEAAALGERLLAGTDWLHSETGALWGVMGAGEGASAALWAASGRGSGISSIVACAPQLESAADRLDAVDAHTLLIVGGADRRALRQARWARRRLAHSEMVVVPGATRLFDAPAALRVLSERSVDWFKKTLVGEGQSEEIARERMSFQSKKRLAAVASLFLMTGWALAPKAFPTVTAFFDQTGDTAVSNEGFAGHLGVAIGASIDTQTVAVGVDGLGNVAVNYGGVTLPIDDDSVAASQHTTLTVAASDVRRIVISTNGQYGTGSNGRNGARLYDLTQITQANFPNIPTGLRNAVLPTNNSAVNYYVLCIDGDQNSTLLGSEFPDSLSGQGGADTIYGYDGGDRIVGGNGNDRLFAGPGNNYVDAGAGNDSVVGEEGNDTLDGGDDRDTIYGNGGDDTIDLGNGLTAVTVSEAVYAGDGNDTIDGAGQYNSTIDGGAGTDQMSKTGAGLFASLGANAGNVMILTPGVDPGSGVINVSSRATPVTTYVCNFTGIEIPGLEGRGDITDNVTVVNNDSCDDLLDGSAWNGTRGMTFDDGGNGSGNDTLIGSGGPDTFGINYGSDSVVGGAGDDYVNISGNSGTNPYKIAIAPTIDASGNGSASYAFYYPTLIQWTPVFSGIERLRVAGGSFNDTNDTTLLGDTLDASAVSLATTVTLEGNNGRDLVIGTANSDVLNGNAQNDTIQAGAGNDTLSGGSEDDSLVGELGNDSLNGGAGVDTAEGGAGNDTINVGNRGDGSGIADGGADTDVLIASFGDNADTASSTMVLVDALLTMTYDTVAENDTLASIEQANLTGGGQFYTNTTPVNDSIDAGGFSGRVLLDGGNGGDDTMVGTTNDDTFNVNFGLDVLAPRAGTDLLNWDILMDTSSAGGNQYSTVPVNAGATLTGNLGDILAAQIDTLTVSFNLESFEDLHINSANGADTLDIGQATLPAASPVISGQGGNDLILGSPLADALNGNGQDDTVAGGDGADTLFGGTQNDSLAGGLGEDRYDGLSGLDTISDEGGADSVNLASVGAAVAVEVGSLAIRDAGGNQITGEGVDDVIGTSLGDRFEVALNGTTLATAMLLDGGAGADTLLYDPTGLAGVTTTGTQTAGTISASSVPDIYYVNMEDVEVRAIVSGARVWQEFE